MSDEIGQRGEALFYVLITKSFGRVKPLFRPQFLGDKFPSIDFIVELIDAGDNTPFFFVQVKTTRKGYTKKERKLKIKISKNDLIKLASYPVPTYIIGIDEVQETGYITSANRNWASGISSLPTEFPINKTTQEVIWREVKQFWDRRPRRRKASKFDVVWR